MLKKEEREQIQKSINRLKDIVEGNRYDFGMMQLDAEGGLEVKFKRAIAKNKINMEVLEADTKTMQDEIVVLEAKLKE